VNKVILEGEVRRVRKVRREQRVLLARRVWRAQPALRLKALAAAIPCSRLVVFSRHWSARVVGGACADSLRLDGVRRAPA